MDETYEKILSTRQVNISNSNSLHCVHHTCFLYRNVWDGMPGPWSNLINLIVENGTVADVITVMEKAKSPPEHCRWWTDLPAQFIPDLAGPKPSQTKPPKLEIWNTLKFFKVLKKHNFLHGLDEIHRVGILGSCFVIFLAFFSNL